MFSSLLPKPIHSEYVQPYSKNKVKVSKALILPSSSNSTVVSTDGNNQITKLHLNSDGSINYTLTIASAHSNGSVQASYQDTIPLKKKFPNLLHHFPRYTLETCPDNSLRVCLDETKMVIQNLLAPKVKDTKSEVSYVNYKSSSVNDEESREIQIRTYQEDPMLPPKFKLRKNRHKAPEAPTPILKDTKETTLTKEEREKWKIPAAISNWKNNQGFTIALDKRVLANGQPTINDVNIEKFGDLSSALESAEKTSRIELQERQEALKEQAEKEKKEKAAQLQELSSLARSHRRDRPSEENDRKRARY